MDIILNAAAQATGTGTDIGTAIAIPTPTHIPTEVLGNFKPWAKELEITPLEGTRTCVVQYRNAKDLAPEKVKQSVYCRVPTEHLTSEKVEANLSQLMPYFVSYLREVEDREIRAYHAQGGLSYYTDGMGMSKLLELLEASNESARLTKAKIETWYDDGIDSVVFELLISGLRAKNPEIELEDSPELSRKLGAISEGFKAKFVQLVSVKNVLKDADRQALLKVLELARSKDVGMELVGRFTSQLEGMKDEVSLLDSLGGGL